MSFFSSGLSGLVYVLAWPASFKTSKASLGTIDSIAVQLLFILFAYRDVHLGEKAQVNPPGLGINVDLIMAVANAT